MSRGGPWPHCREGMSVVQILGSFQENERQFQLTWCVIIREKYFYCNFVEPRGIFCGVSYWVTLNSLWINPLFIWTALQDFKTSTIKSEINDHKNIKYTCSLVCSTAHHSSASSALCLWVTFGEWHSGCEKCNFCFPTGLFPCHCSIDSYIGECNNISNQVSLTRVTSHWSVPLTLSTELCFCVGLNMKFTTIGAEPPKNNWV